MDAIVRHLVAGLERIAALKDAKQSRDPIDALADEPNADAEGFRPIHPRMKKGLEVAARMARETLASMPPEESTTLYMVTDGKYSDYTVCGIYSTRENAEYARRLFNARNQTVEQKADALPEHPQGLLSYRVQMLREGEAVAVTRGGVEYPVCHEWAPYGDGKTVAFYVWAEDEPHASKIANERRAKLIALDQWTTDWKEWKEALVGPSDGPERSAP